MDRLPIFGIFSLLFWSCTAPAGPPDNTTNTTVEVASAMRNVMWKGELQGKIKLDTIAQRDHLIAVGPVSYLRGEIMAVDGEVFVSRVGPEGNMNVEKTADVAAPFLVYANVPTWREVTLPATVKTIADLEQYLDGVTKSLPRPFPFRLEGKVTDALIHVQNLAPGTRVSSPQEAHSGQVKYPLGATEATIAGFFSTEHQGVFTHHDTYLHLHLLTADHAMMGHVDALNIGEMQLYLPQ